MQWFMCIFRPVLERFMRQTIGEKAYGDKPASREDKEAVRNELTSVILAKLESHLKENERKFFCSDDDLTIIDI